MRVIKDPELKHGCIVQLTKEDVESAIRAFICECHPELKVGFIVNPTHPLTPALFEAHKPI